ncbi:1,4-dihydroxy-2-naphthoate octaprenyltransferase [Prevotella fusca]|uniref:1,4-dihydroxy-2-naphthoate octaprenyltransferase n=1 Tax=Prevotella fusca JCM 17724 TaxID=1236517 RepID=A0A0K1NME9_9BACT|nr:1,4-dihydroxy-2-naphthoate octaprenyltransferase [Prevotella fusca]AKU70259.1 1,4-dihydroxy-2-naphthoate prenyltransferase [Prevotella fusca JCM 17724]QUB85880.1 1,4-dihydroxy-2-naphthoate octaprenyltransferase [Prevotella fusca JCM 17724]
MISENDNIKTNSLAAWILAARPKTLTGAMVPVMIGAAWAWKISGGENFRIVPAILCFLFAFLMQIDSNFINDYFDCVKGNDDHTTRLGPKRACSEGWITLPAMRIGLVFTSLLACLVGLPLIFFGGWKMILVGVVCVVFAFLYTTYFSYLGLGDLLVLVFFGIVPVVFTTYVILPDHSQALCLKVIMSGVICGLVIDTLLVVNNYRDRDNDKRDGKITLIVRIGEEEAEKLYTALGLMSYLQMACILFLGEKQDTLFVIFLCFIFAPYGILHYKTAMLMKKIKKGKELNLILAHTARNMLLYGIATTIAIVSS